MQRFTPATEAITVPDIHASLDEESAKRAFWTAFRQLKGWYDDQPPW